MVLAKRLAHREMGATMLRCHPTCSQACFKKKRVSWTLGASSNVHGTREVHSLSLQKATCLQDHRLRLRSVEEHRRSGERDGFPEALEQGPIPKPFSLLLQEMGTR